MEKHVVRIAQTLQFVGSLSLICLVIDKQANETNPEYKSYYFTLTVCLVILSVLQQILLDMVIGKTYSQKPFHFQQKHLLESIEDVGVDLNEVKSLILPIALPYLEMRLWWHKQHSL